MSIQKALAEASAKPKGKRPRFLESWEAERALAVAMSLAGELVVTRQRLDTLERLLAAKGIVSRAEIDSFAPSKAEAAERGLWNQEFLARVLRVVQQEAEAISASDDSSENIAEELAR
ncbi:hypothetical protein [Niveispirillum cyanobacteriorum]|uniref:Uncharacterized protein n=1 Tax=Niveispirillum cyanobacteriorum TaxID=1612173 RepID=A0A2K9NKA8_9PROT|nr:hypothetical protein [Niveispirillum cyanobacteriorum]AUN32785.1 hypothetical protein C0V82_21020 [Niveispirillum cyanobacteriorum]GGE87765.1 hypothetical protein GCM10011317_50950 [Niveispirillum cyanobacteriorum]